MKAIQPALMALLGACAMSALAEAVFDDGDAAWCVRAVCGLCIALSAARLALGILE